MTNAHDIAERLIRQSKTTGEVAYCYPTRELEPDMRNQLYGRCATVKHYTQDREGDLESLYTGEGWSVLVYAER